MELKKFVTQALVEIVEAVQDAQEKTAKTGALINPQGTHYTTHTNQNLISLGDPRGLAPRYGQIVEFDVSVTASEHDETQGGVGIQVASITIGAGISGKIEDENSVISKLKFSIPVFLPESNKR